jgi:two-component system sensor histidine kinase PilS (NtrC family)
MDDYRLSLEESPVEIRLETEAEIPAIRFDPDQLQQVLWNLLHNAKKHGKPATGRLEIDMRVTVNHEKKRVILSVCDNGELLNEDEQERLFDPFYSTNITGVGLGLYIAHELCIKNGARLDYARQNNRNCFRIHCPAVPDKA